MLRILTKANLFALDAGLKEEGEEKKESERLTGRDGDHALDNVREAGEKHAELVAGCQKGLVLKPDICGDVRRLLQKIQI